MVRQRRAVLGIRHGELGVTLSAHRTLEVVMSAVGSANERA
jgi:hypothetical protein